MRAVARYYRTQRLLESNFFWRLVNMFHGIRFWIYNRIVNFPYDPDDDRIDSDDSGTRYCIKDYPSDSSLETNEPAIRVEYLTVKSDIFRINLLRVIKRRLQEHGFERFEACTKEGLSNGLLKCLKEQMGKERDLAADCLRLLAVELRAEGSTIYLDKIDPELTPLLTDSSIHYKTRAACAATLATWCYLCSSDLQKFQALSKNLEEMFRSGCGQGDNSLFSSGQGDNPQNLTSQHIWLMCNVLGAWCLLLTNCTQDEIQAHIRNHGGSLKELLKSSDEELRMAAGETIVLLYELGRGSDKEFREEEDEPRLCQLLKNLASEFAKQRAKKSRRRQKASFRDVYRNVVAAVLEVAAFRAKTNLCAITGRECQHHLSSLEADA